ncbi:MAG TPA: type II toxin-antitoxin system VapC family toxin, partial [Candidatus Cloacimonetes bacterium]|nr:type II toxin-antitoxin system VapC family toxin [Candidatus Cloacimonadota bacterium]
MENKNVLIDTNIIIDFFRKRNKKNTILRSILIDHNIYLSVVSIFEFECGVTNKVRKDEFQTLIEPFRILNFDLDCSLISAKVYRELKQKNKIIEMRDIFIGSTAIKNNLRLLTLNKRHFE